MDRINKVGFLKHYYANNLSDQERKSVREEIQGRALKNNDNGWNEVALGQRDGLWILGTGLFNLILGAPWSWASFERESVLIGTRGESLRAIMLQELEQDEAIEPAEKDQLRAQIRALEKNDLEALFDIALEVHTELNRQLSAVFSTEGRRQELVMWRSADDTQRIYVSNCRLYFSDDPLPFNTQRNFVAFALAAARNNQKDLVWHAMQTLGIERNEPISLPGADFSYLPLGGIDFSNVILRGANFVGATFGDPETKTKFTCSDLTEATFNKRPGEIVDFNPPPIPVNVDLTDAILIKSNCFNLDFSGSICVRTNLSHSDLGHAKFPDVDMHQAKLTEALVDGANFKTAKNIGSASISNAFNKGAGAEFPKTEPAKDRLATGDELDDNSVDEKEYLLGRINTPLQTPTKKTKG